MNGLKRAQFISCAFVIFSRNIAAFHIPGTSSCAQPRHRHRHFLQTNQPLLRVFHSSTNLNAAPKRGSIVDSYQTVSVNCNSCRTRLFRYKKKNGTKSNLIKCYVERIVEAEDGDLQQQVENFANLDESHQWCCPGCGVNFARCAMIRGLPALKLVGGKTRMTKKWGGSSVMLSLVVQSNENTAFWHSRFGTWTYVCIGIEVLHIYHIQHFFDVRVKNGPFKAPI